MGNHKVAMLPRTRQLSRIMIYHYTVGNRETFMQKMIQGGRELEQHKRQRRGVHWRYFYRLYKEGKLSEEYDRVIGQNQYERLVTDGYIVEDHTICDFFRQKLLIK